MCGFGTNLIHIHQVRTWTLQCYNPNNEAGYVRGNWAPATNEHRNMHMQRSTRRGPEGADAVAEVTLTGLRSLRRCVQTAICTPSELAFRWASTLGDPPGACADDGDEDRQNKLTLWKRTSVHSTTHRDRDWGSGDGEEWLRGLTHRVERDPAAVPAGDRAPQPVLPRPFDPRSSAVAPLPHLPPLRVTARR